MINIKNENELLALLKIISEESVSMSKKYLNESSDPYVDEFAKQFAADKKTYGKLSEQEEEEEEQEEEEEEDKVDSAEFAASFDSVVRAINNLRAGRSLKDSSIRDEVSTYYDRLSDDERAVLLLFLREISKILLGVVDGDEAQDPSDPLAYFNIRKRAKDEPNPDDEPKGDRPSPSPGKKKSQKPAPKLKGKDTEDVTPPIRVNEAQDYNQLRRKIRRLILKN